MQRRKSYLYVGMDLHKKTHTAVLTNCWNEKIENLVIENKPAKSLAADSVNRILWFALFFCPRPANAYHHPHRNSADKPEFIRPAGVFLSRRMMMKT